LLCSVAAVQADDATCTPISTYAERIAAARKLSEDAKGCFSLDTGQLTMWICKADAAAVRTVDLMVKGSGAPVGIRATHVLEWSSALEMKDGQGFGFNQSGLVVLNDKEAVSARFTDFWRDDPTVSNLRPPPSDRVEVAKGAAGALACTGAAPAPEAVMRAIAPLHRPGGK